MKPLILIDMDGVLADLNSGIFEKFGVKEPENNRDRLFKELLPDYTHSKGFERQGVLSGAYILIDELLTLVEKEYINIAICTSTGNFYQPVSEVRDQKSKWINRCFPNIVNIPFVTTTSGADKSFFANKNTFLIDDHYKNCERFIENGGEAWIYKSDDDPKQIMDFIINHFNLKIPA